MDEQAWAAVFGAYDSMKLDRRPSWYWCPERKSFVLAADGKTTPEGLGLGIKNGDPVTQAEVDYWAMVAAKVDQWNPVGADR